MAKHFVPVAPTARTPVDPVRDRLDQAENWVSSPQRSTPQVLELVRLLDEIADALVALEAAGVDVRAERVRFENVQVQLQKQQAWFVARAGSELKNERLAVHPDPTRWWWFLDEAVAHQRSRRLRRWLIGAAAAVLLLAAAWLAYDRFIAPPREVRQAYSLTLSAERLAGQGDLRAALADVEEAATLAPDYAPAWVWKGVITAELNEPEAAEAAFRTARSLYQTEFDFLQERAFTYLRVGDLEAAEADADQAIRENPESGHGYYVRAGVYAEQEDYTAAVVDLDQAAALASVAGDTKLEATARAQRARVIQLALAQQ